MADQIKFDTNARRILARFDSYPKAMQTAIQNGLARGLLLVEDQVKRRADVRFSGSRQGLASRLTSYTKVAGSAAAIDGIIGFRRTRGFPYELAQEFGAKAKPGGAMAIPITPEAKHLSQLGKSAKDFPRKLFIPGSKGDPTGVLAESVGANRMVVHYVLVKSIPPRLHFRENVTDNLDIVADHVNAAVGDAL